MNIRKAHQSPFRHFLRHPHAYKTEQRNPQ
jgi:hypothetical protein